MTQFPHQYSVTAAGKPEGSISLTAEGLPTLASAPPTDFGGPGDQWSPEDLIVAAVADCFALSFRAIAAASKVSWNELHCDVVGTLDRVERDVRFTEFKVTVRLTIPADQDEARAQRSLEKAEKMCFITNSLNGEVHLVATVETA
jgi:organic hydroperoxide reductase OsmC/OhrA